MNEYDIRDANRHFNEDEQPNVVRAAHVLYRLMNWTNERSDGWMYWQKPSRAAKRLMALVQDAYARERRGDYTDATEAALKAALTPIKAFLTREGEAHSEVI